MCARSGGLSRFCEPLSGLAQFLPALQRLIDPLRQLVSTPFAGSVSPTSRRGLPRANRIWRKLRPCSGSYSHQRHPKKKAPTEAGVSDSIIRTPTATSVDGPSTPRTKEETPSAWTRILAPDASQIASLCSFALARETRPEAYRSSRSRRLKAPQSDY